MLAIIAPGQGSQTPGMFNSWVTNPVFHELLSQWSMRIDLDLIGLGTKADADEIRDTANAQPLIVAASLLGAHALGIKSFAYTSGHSVGELAAAAISGAICDEDALRLVRARGIEMAKAAALSPAGMSAVLGGDREVVLKKLEELKLVAANGPCACRFRPAAARASSSASIWTAKSPPRIRFSNPTASRSWSTKPRSNWSRARSSTMSTISSARSSS